MSSTDFAEHFRHHVLPRLVNLTRAQAYLIQHNVETFGNAHRRILAEADKYGARYLSNTRRYELFEWITDTLSLWIHAPPLEGSLGLEQSTRLWQSLEHLAPTTGEPDPHDTEEPNAKSEGE